jgi:hypothetical protein
MILATPGISIIPEIDEALQKQFRTYASVTPKISCRVRQTA